MEVSADQLQQAVEGQHGGKAVLVSVEPVKETTVWEGTVHVCIRSPVDAVRAAIVAENKGRR